MSSKVIRPSPRPSVREAVVRGPRIARRSVCSLSQIRTRRISLNQDMMAFLDAQDNESILEDLLEHNWILYRCGPLFDVPKDDESFLRLSEKLSRVMSLQGHAGSFVVKVGRVKGLQGSLADHQALKFSVHMAYCGQVSSSAVTTAFLLGIGSTDLDLHSECAAVLPVLLMKGEKSAMQPLVMGMELMFDCVISKITFEQEELMWLLILWCGNESKRKENNELLLDYESPIKEHIKTIQIAVDYAHIFKLWKSIHPTQESDLLSTEMEDFQAQLYLHIYKAYGIRLHLLPIMAFSNPAVSISRNGNIKFHSLQCLKHILGNLTHKFQDNFNIHSRISAQIEFLTME